MSRNKPNRSTSLHLAKKFTVSVFLTGTFVAYAIHDRLTNSSDPATILSPSDVVPGSTASSSPSVISTVRPAVNPPVLTQRPSTTIPQDTSTSAPVAISIPTTAPSDTPTELPTDIPTDIPTNIPTQLPTTTPTKSGLYKSGQYTGDVADAFYGNVQVKVIITNGKITTVQFLNYPHDRRTSQQINNYAMPYLKTEAIQAQTANVDIISGATLTSEAFVQSLQSALTKASA